MWDEDWGGSELDPSLAGKRGSCEVGRMIRQLRPFPSLAFVRMGAGALLDARFLLEERY